MAQFTFSQEELPFTKGSTLFELELYDHAIEKFKSALSKNPSHVEAHRMLALSLVKKRRFRAAEHEARLGVKLAPDDPFSYLTLGSVLGDTGKLNEAEAMFQKAMEMDPGEQEIINSLAQVKILQGKYKEAEILSLQSLKISAIDPRAIGILAVSYQNQRKYDEALELYFESLKNDPENPGIHNNIGAIYLYKKQPRKGIEHFRAALRSDPGMKIAKKNLVNAIKAKNFIYGYFWQFTLFFSRFSIQQQGVIFVLFYAIFYSLAIYSKHTGKYEGIVLQITIFYLLFCISSWVLPPLFNKLVESGWIR